MRHKYYGFLEVLGDWIEWLFADKVTRDYLRYVPKNCKVCELLGICRDKDNRWKCHHGCMLINSRQDRNRRK